MLYVYDHCQLLLRLAPALYFDLHEPPLLYFLERLQLIILLFFYHNFKSCLWLQNMSAINKQYITVLIFVTHRVMFPVVIQSLLLGVICKLLLG